MKPNGGPVRLVLYARVSLAKQADDGCSLEAQRERLLAWAKASDAEVVEFIEDVGTGADLERPGVQRALDMIRRGRADGVAVVKLDRLSRSVRDVAILCEDVFGPGGARLVSLAESLDTGTAVGQLLIGILSTFSQWERRAIGERTSAALRHMRATGAYTGGEAPYGYRLDAGRLVPIEAEQRAVALARQLRGDGLSLRRIAVNLTDAGLLARNGRPFGAVQVDRICRAPAPVAAREVA